MDGLYKCGHVDVKFPNKSRRISRKVWRRRWLVISPMSDLVAEKYMAKLDIYQDSDSSKRSHTDKVSILLENVTDIKSAKSKTHPHAFEVCEGSTSPICVSGESESESNAWGWTLRQIFWPNNKDWYDVTLVDNSHSARIKLHGSYRLNVTTQSVCLLKPVTNCPYTWSLASLKRFYIDTALSTANRRVIVFQAGPQSESGEGTFLFESTRADSILQTIRENISKALIKDQTNLVSRKENIRSLSVCTADSSSSQCSRHRTISEDDDIHVLDSDSIFLRTVSASFSNGEDSLLVNQGVISNNHSDIDIVNERNCIERKRNVLQHPKDFEDDGYSQIPISSLSLETTIKVRSVSSLSFKLKPSDSISSRDSGVIFSSPESHTGVDDVDVGMDIFRDTSHSFDSAISVASHSSFVRPRATPDSRSAVKDTLTVSPMLVDILTPGPVGVSNPTILQTNPFLNSRMLNKLSPVTDRANEDLHLSSDSGSSNSIHIYSDIDIEKTFWDSNSRKDFIENDYEDLDKFRKNLTKFFGTDVSQSENSPPRLPDRNMNNKSNLMSTLPRMSSKISAREEDDINDVIARIDRWPLGLTSRARENSIYSQSARVYRRPNTTEKDETLKQLETTSSMHNIDLLTGDDVLQSTNDSLITMPSQVSPFSIESPNSPMPDFTWSRSNTIDVFDATWATHITGRSIHSTSPLDYFNDNLMSLPIVPTDTTPSVRLSSSAENIDANRCHQDFSKCTNYADYTADNGLKNEYSRFPEFLNNTLTKKQPIIKWSLNENYGRQSTSSNGQLTSGPSPSEWIKRLEDSQNKQNEVYIDMSGEDNIHQDADEYVAPAILRNT